TQLSASGTEAPHRLPKAVDLTPKPVDLGPKAVDLTPKVVESEPKAPSTFEKGDMLLNAARTELKKGDSEAARKIAIDVINGKYDSDLKDEAQTLLKSI